jgi:DNA-binding NarL/FixJ family response regulator
MHTTQSLTPALSPQTVAAHSEEGMFTADGEPTATTLLMLRLLGTGATEPVIARKLGTSTRTVQRRIAQLQELVGVHSRFQLGMIAANRGWVGSSDPQLNGGQPGTTRA